MDNHTSKTKNPEQETHLIRIIPVETDRSDKETTQRTWTADKQGRFFPTNLTMEQLRQALAKTKVKMENVMLKVDGDFFVYRYKGRPLIRLYLKDGQFYAPSSVVEEFGKELVQHQAHMVLEKLRECHMSNAVVGKSVALSSARDVLSKLKSYSKDA
jgi:hypothetical protein